MFGMQILSPLCITLLQDHTSLFNCFYVECKFYIEFYFHCKQYILLMLSYMSYVFCTYICVISVHYTLSACHNGTHIPGTQYVVLMCFVYSCSKHIAYKIHRTLYNEQLQCLVCFTCFRLKSTLETWRMTLKVDLLLFIAACTSVF